jgi:hypothetical protein
LGPTLRSGDDLFKTVGQASQIMRVREDENSFEVAVDTHEYYPGIFLSTKRHPYQSYYVN